MWKLIALSLGALVVALVGISLVDIGQGDVSANAIIAIPRDDLSGFTRAFEPHEWSFPRDHGAHPDYQTEWWYYTGNLSDENGRRFGFQFTIFRRAITPVSAISTSEWRTGQVYMAHFTVSDIANGAFYHDERYSRGGADLAGSAPNPAAPDAPFRVWLDDWVVEGLNEDASAQSMKATANGYSVDLTLNQVKPIVLQGEDGLSPKSDEPGNASQYYSMPRMETSGSVTIGDDEFVVTGSTWMDREFSTSALGTDAVGWDWFGLQFDDGRELVVGQIRLADGGVETTYTGTVIYEDGESYHLKPEDYSITATEHWTSPYTGAEYPAGWIITVSAEAMQQEADLSFTVTPLQADQELHSGDIAYWEGAVQLSGGVTGFGYAELTGYIDALTGRF